MLLSENSGKHISVKVGLFTLLTAAVFIVCLIGATAVSINGYLEVFQQNKIFKHLVKEMESSLKELKQEKREAVLYKEWADKIVFRRFNYEDITGQGNNFISKDTLDGEIHGKSFKASVPAVDVDDFDVRRINLELDFEFSFKLVNRSQGRKNLS